MADLEWTNPRLTEIRLGLFLSTIVFVNQDGYFGPCIKRLARAQEGLDAIEAAVLGSSDARDFAAI